MCIRYSRFFWFYHKIYEIVTDNLPIKIYGNKIQNKITYKIRTGCYFELLTTEAIKLLGNARMKITNDGEEVIHLEIIEVIFMRYNIVNKDYWHDSRALHTFVYNKSFDQLLDNSAENFEFLKIFN